MPKVASTSLNPFATICPMPTPGPLGYNDFADPMWWIRRGVCGLLGPSAGPLGQNDHTSQVAPATSSSAIERVKSGTYWVNWANSHAQNSESLDSLEAIFKGHVQLFKAALEAAGAKVDIKATQRHPDRAYLFHWCWLVGLGKIKPSEAKPRLSVPIIWDHGDVKSSIAGASEMIKGFGLAVPPHSKLAPALNSNHIAGKAVDMDITWSGTIAVTQKDGKKVQVTYMSDPNSNSKLHAVGASYSVIKNTNDAPHWSVDGH